MLWRGLSKGAAHLKYLKIPQTRWLRATETDCVKSNVDCVPSEGSGK